MKKYFSILYCLAALAAGCDDNNKEALAFDLSTDEWSFAKEGGTQNLIVLAPGVWKVSEKPDWCTLIPEGAGSQDQLLGQYRKKARGNACADLWR